MAWDGRGFNPVFPLTVSIVISSLGIVDVFSASAYLNIIALGLSILIVVIWLSDKIAYRTTIIFGGVACSFSPLLGNQHAMARTEPLFILFVIISLFTLDRFLDSNKRSLDRSFCRICFPKYSNPSYGYFFNNFYSDASRYKKPIIPTKIKMCSHLSGNYAAYYCSVHITELSKIRTTY